MSEERLKRLEAILRTQFTPEVLKIRDDSALHIGHAAAGGGGHFAVMIVSEAFVGLSRVKRHQAVFAALASLMGNEIHALSIEAKTPSELSS